MYQYSLQWFENLFKMGIENAPAHSDIPVRLKNLNEYFMYSLYENVCRSLFGRHKLLFSFLLAIKMMKGFNELPEQEWKYLLTGYGGELKVPNCPVEWISENAWNQIYKSLYGLDQLKSFSGILNHFLEQPESWKHLYDSNEPQDEIFPDPWEEKFNAFMKINVLNAVRSDKVKNGIQNFVIERLGKPFVDIPVFKLGQVFKDSNSVTPLVFILSTGTDPKADFDSFSLEQGMKNINSISLGQGQGEKAERMIKDAARPNGVGGWVLLQNCHLAATWMERMEATCEEFNADTTHKDFRLWLTSMPSAQFPISVLQNSVKMTMEPPTGIKANLKNTYNLLDDEKLNDCTKPDDYKKLCFSLSFFHAIVQERRKFGPIGWNISYEFTIEDMVCSRKQLKVFLEQYDVVPFQVINFITAEINYGGRVTDDKDQILIKKVLELYMCPEALVDDYKYSESGIYKAIEPGSQADYLNYIDTLPLNPSPEAFGLHDNAAITTAQDETLKLLETVLSIQPRTVGGAGKTREEIIGDLATTIESKMPTEFNEKQVFKDYPVKYEESMNTVLCQEVSKYNRLIIIMKSSLFQVKRALQGLIVMNDELETLSNSLFNQAVPVMWSDVFLSLKPLISWIGDLNKRVSFLKEWVEYDTPNIYWISGFSFPQAFLTGMLQNFARMKQIAIDKIKFDFMYMDDKTIEEIKEKGLKPEYGVYVYGLFVEGCKWDYTTHEIGLPTPKELYSELPIMWMIPVEDRIPPEKGIYNCPLYRVTSRTGTLKTTGHSTNYVMFLEMPTQAGQDTWVRAGAASFLALRY